MKLEAWTGIESQLRQKSGKGLKDLQEFKSPPQRHHNHGGIAYVVEGSIGIYRDNHGKYARSSMVDHGRTLLVWKQDPLCMDRKKAQTAQYGNAGVAKWSKALGLSVHRDV